MEDTAGPSCSSRSNSVQNSAEDIPPAAGIEQNERENVEDCPPPSHAEIVDEMFEQYKVFGSKGIDVKSIQQVMKGPRCWKCYEWAPFFECNDCGKHFHRDCAFMAPGFPHPIFDKSVEEACKAKYGQVKLLKCAPCIVAEETRVAELRNIELDDLNRLFCLFTKNIIIDCAGDLLVNFPPDDPNAITAPKIVEKASRNEYKTVEGFFADFRMILFNIIVKYSMEDEATDVAKIVLKNVTYHLTNIVNSCWECGLNRFQEETGRALNQKTFFPINCKPCKVPHAVLWVKEGTFPYWPTKILNMKDDKIYFQSFGEKACLRVQDFPCKGWEFKTYSTMNKYKGDKEKKRNAAESNCKKYLDNLRETFGEVVVPDESENFDGDLPALMKKMFPLYNNGNENEEEDPVVVA